MNFVHAKQTKCDRNCLKDFLEKKYDIINQKVFIISKLTNCLTTIRTCEEGHPLNPRLTFSKKVSKKESGKMSKDIRKTIRFSKSEFEQIQSNLDLSQITFSDFARSAILRKKIKLPVEKKLLFELNKIGTNLNQIAKAVNSRKDKIQILTELVEIEKSIKELIK